MPASTGTTRYWISTNGNPNSTSSWSANTVPIDGDTVVYSPRFSKYPMVTDWSSNKDFYLVRVEEGWDSDWGGSGGPIHFAADTLEILGAGSYHYKISGSVNTDLLVVNSPNHVDALFLYSDGTRLCSTIRLANGHTQISSSYPTGTSVIEVGTQQNLSPTLTAHNASSVIASTMVCTTGLIYNYRGVTTANQNGGTWFQEEGQVSTLFLNGGTHNMNQTDTLANAYLTGGLLDLTRNDLAKTISSCSLINGRGKIRYNTKHSVTFANMTGKNEASER